MRDIRAAKACWPSSDPFACVRLTLVQLFGLLFQKLSIFQLCQLVYGEDMKPSYPLVTFYVLRDADMTLIGKILTNTSRSIPYEAMRVPESSQGCWWFR